ncbi:MAG: hypothetical protein JWR32_637 [Mycobacterium sp.]|nr:hypothetical protein [Mycobacterium sp.]
MGALLRVVQHDDIVVGTGGVVGGHHDGTHQPVGCGTHSLSDGGQGFCVGCAPASLGDQQAEVRCAELGE